MKFIADFQKFTVADEKVGGYLCLNDCLFGTTTIIHDSNFKPTLERVCRKNERCFDLLLQILIKIIYFTS